MASERLRFACSYVSSIQTISFGKYPNFSSGPLSDTYGRKPLITISLVGFFILNLVFIVNSIWFMELKVEYIFFE